MNCGLNSSFISCGELHCDSVKIKPMIHSSLFFLRQCESLDWSDCLVVLLLSATHFRKNSHVRLIRGCFSFHSVFGQAFSLLSPPSPPLSAPFNSPHLLLSLESFNMALSRANCMLKENAEGQGKWISPLPSILPLKYCKINCACNSFYHQNFCFPPFPTYSRHIRYSVDVTG